MSYAILDLTTTDADGVVTYHGCVVERDGKLDSHGVIYPTHGVAHVAYREYRRGVYSITTAIGMSKALPLCRVCGDDERKGGRVVDGKCNVCGVRHE